jgi:biopolymer transport protein ExbD
MALGKLPDNGAEEVEEASDGIFAEINITPLTDVFLVMVVIFMVTALAEVEQSRKQQQETKKEAEQSETEKKSGLRVNLPSGKAQDIDSSKASLILTIPVQGDIDIGGKTIPDPQIDQVFAAAFARDKNTQVILKADKSVAHGKVVNIMERAKNAGLTRLAIGTSGG